jgi:hypothetical protein
MTMPGFTAHSSLYKTSTSYRTIGNSGQNDGVVYSAGQMVTPQYDCRILSNGCHRCCDWQYGFCWTYCPWDPPLM